MCNAEMAFIVVGIETRRPVQLVDVTAALERAIREAGLLDGLMVAQTRHTTTGLLVNEHEPLLFRDLEGLFERLAPAGADYAHDDFARRTVNLMPGERRNGCAHCRAALLRSSETLAVRGGEIGLGRWQRVFLVELDGPQRRELSLTLVGRWRPDPPRSACDEAFRNEPHVGRTLGQPAHVPREPGVAVGDEDP
jgi:secondary thiamine-phosphate synthase enzyme